MKEQTIKSVKHYIYKQCENDENELLRLNEAIENKMNYAYLVGVWCGAGYWLDRYIIYSDNYDNCYELLEEAVKMGCHTFEITYEEEETHIKEQSLDDDDCNDIYSYYNYILMDNGLCIYGENLKIENFDEYAKKNGY